MIHFVKILRQLHLSRYLYKVVAPFAHSTIDYNEKSLLQSIDFLQGLSADLGKTSICHNEIDQTPAYDLQIIIPAYKVEKYIAQCLDSILAQETTYRYLICVINDGSPDNTRSILKQYEGLDNIIIIDQENKGFSGARNTGLSKIHARYVMFVDSDDYLDSNHAIQQLMDCASHNNADIVEGGYRLFYGNKTLQYCKRKDVVGPQAQTYGFPWGKVYRARLWENIHFPENYWFEDSVNEFMVFPIALLKANVSTCVYAYRKNRKGISVMSHHNVRTIDCVWITRQLMTDQKTSGQYDPTRSLLCLLRQMAVNQRRLETLGRKDILHAAFQVHKSLFEQYYTNEIENVFDGDQYCTAVVQAFEKNDFAAYRAATLLL